MKINKTESPSFKAIYKIPYSKSIVSELQTKIFPMYNKVSNQPVAWFAGNNPFNASIEMILKMISEKFNSSVEWVKMNATLHGAEEQDLNTECLHVVTGNKDIERVKNYIQKRIELLENEMKDKNSLSTRIKRLFIKEDQIDLGFSEKTPEHLRFLFYLLKHDKKEEQAFQCEFDNVISVKTVKEMFIKMLQER